MNSSCSGTGGDANHSILLLFKYSNTYLRCEMYNEIL